MQGTIASHNLSEMEAKNLATDTCQCSNMCGKDDCSDHTLEWLAGISSVIGGGNNPNYH